MRGVEVFKQELPGRWRKSEQFCVVGGGQMGTWRGGVTQNRVGSQSRKALIDPFESLGFHSELSKESMKGSNQTLLKDCYAAMLRKEGWTGWW